MEEILKLTNHQYVATSGGTASVVERVNVEDIDPDELFGNMMMESPRDQTELRMGSTSSF